MRAPKSLKLAKKGFLKLLSFLRYECIKTNSKTFLSLFYKKEKEKNSNTNIKTRYHAQSQHLINFTITKKIDQ